MPTGGQDIVSAVGNAWSTIGTWLHAPFRSTSLAPLDYFLLVGLFLVSFIVWQRVVSHMERLTGE